MFGLDVKDFIILLLCILACVMLLRDFERYEQDKQRLVDSLKKLERIELVSKYYKELLVKIGEAADNDIARGLAWEWRYRRLEQITIEEMINSPHIPVEAFYEDTSFLEPSPIAGMSHEAPPLRERLN